MSVNGAKQTIPEVALMSVYCNQSGRSEARHELRGALQLTAIVLYELYCSCLQSFRDIKAEKNAFVDLT
jgi:hypothetical protein